MKPKLMRRSDFFGSKGIVAQSDVGAYVVREGNEYQLGVELDVDTVVYLDKTNDNDQVQLMLDQAVYDIGNIRDRFQDCYPE